MGNSIGLKCVSDGFKLFLLVALLGWKSPINLGQIQIVSAVLDKLKSVPPSMPSVMPPPLFEMATASSDWLSNLLSAGQVPNRPDWQSQFGNYVYSNIYGSAPSVPTLSLFSGAGGLDIGFHDVGFEVAEMVEVERDFSATLQANAAADGIFSSAEIHTIDIRDYFPEQSKGFDFIIGGPPCQTFSAAGRRVSGVQGTQDDRGTLFEEYVRLLRTLKPAGFLFENVYAILGARQGQDWSEIVAAFDSAGYVLSFRILDTADYGVPQHRERVFIVGIRDDLAKEVGIFRFPRPTHGPDSLTGRPHETAGFAVQGLDDDLDGLKVAGRYGGLLKEIPPGLNYSFFTAEMGHPRPVFAWRSKFSDFLYKADPESPVRTIKAQGGAYTGPLSWESRHFSAAEIKRLQTFPDSYLIQGNRGTAVHQIGNSVPPHMARILAMAVRDQLFGFAPPEKIDYLDPGETLSFRARKRGLTKVYREKALAAHAKRETARPPRTRNIASTLSLWISKDFSVTEDKPEYPAEFFEYHLRREESKLTVELSSPREKQLIDFELLLRPSASWHLEEREIIVCARVGSSLGLTAAFKAVERYIRETYGYEDLVQVSGYFQQNQTLQCSLSVGRVPGERMADWLLVTEVISGNSVGKNFDQRELAMNLGIEDESVPAKMAWLKSIGFEIRNSSTNPQLPAHHYLIPYAFPTLTNRSVQLRKSL